MTCKLGTKWPPAERAARVEGMLRARSRSYDALPAVGKQEALVLHRTRVRAAQDSLHELVRRSVAVGIDVVSDQGRGDVDDTCSWNKEVRGPHLHDIVPVAENAWATGELAQSAASSACGRERLEWRHQQRAELVEELSSHRARQKRLPTFKPPYGAKRPRICHRKAVDGTEICERGHVGFDSTTRSRAARPRADVTVAVRRTILLSSTSTW